MSKTRNKKLHIKITFEIIDEIYIKEVKKTTTTNDANFVGANVKADDTLNLNVGNNLNLESLRDEYSFNLNLTNQDINTLKTNTNLYLQDEIKANNNNGKIDNLCINSMDCYGNKTLSDFRKTVSLKTEDNLGNYNLINQINPDTKNVEFYSLYNEKTGNNVNLKPQELENLKQMAQTDPEKFNNLMAVYEMQSNTTHTVYNAVSGLYDTGYTNGIIDANSRYLQSGEFVLDFLPVGIASKFVGTSSKLSTKVVDDVGITASAEYSVKNLPVTYYPINNGFIGDVTKTYLEVGTLIDRYGKNTGSYVSPMGTPFEMRGLHNKSKNDSYTIYEVMKPIEVNAGTIAPALGNIGLGIQYKLPKNIEILEKKGFIKNVE